MKHIAFISAAVATFAILDAAPVFAQNTVKHCYGRFMVWRATPNDLRTHRDELPRSIIGRAGDGGIVARGACGSSVPDRCRYRAQGRLLQCMTQSFDKKFAGTRDLPTRCTAPFGIVSFQLGDLGRFDHSYLRNRYGEAIKRACCDRELNSSPIPAVREGPTDVTVTAYIRGRDFCGGGSPPRRTSPPQAANDIDNPHQERIFRNRNSQMHVVNKIKVLSCKAYMTHFCPDRQLSCGEFGCN